MPSPLAHTAAGIAIWSLLRGRLAPGRVWHALAVLLFFSLLPDADALPGIAFGDLSRYHNNLTHSVAAGLATAALAGCAARAAKSPRAGMWFWIALLAYLLHVLMDFFTVGRGVMLAWPLSAERFLAPSPVFLGLRWSHSPLDPVHLRTLANEMCFVLALALAVWWVERRRRQAGG
jgi:inner membrane protein